MIVDCRHLRGSSVCCRGVWGEVGSVMWWTVDIWGVPVLAKEFTLRLKLSTLSATPHLYHDIENQVPFYWVLEYVYWTCRFFLKSRFLYGGNLCIWLINCYNLYYHPHYCINFYVKGHWIEQSYYRYISFIIYSFNILLALSTHNTSVVFLGSSGKWWSY